MAKAMTEWHLIPEQNIVNLWKALERDEYLVQANTLTSILRVDNSQKSIARQRREKPPNRGRQLI